MALQKVTRAHTGIKILVSAHDPLQQAGVQQTVRYKDLQARLCMVEVVSKLRVAASVV